MGRCVSEARNRNYAFAGLQYHGQCFAGNELRWNQVSDEECSTTCNANPSQKCGGPWRNSVYAAGGGPTTEDRWQNCQSHYHAHNWNGVINECTQVVNVSPKHRDARVILGIAYHNVAKHMEALANFEYILTNINSKDCEVLLMAQQCEREVDRKDRMVSYICNLLRTCPCYPNKDMYNSLVEFMVAFQKFPLCSSAGIGFCHQ